MENVKYNYTKNIKIFGNFLMGWLNLVLRIGMRDWLTLVAIVFLVMQVHVMSKPKITLWNLGSELDMKSFDG